MKLTCAMIAVVVIASSALLADERADENALHLDTRAPLLLTLQAAQTGDGSAMLQLALASLFAQENATFAPATARVWLMRAHEADQPQATWLLGQMVRDGVTMPADPVLAMSLLDKAATQGQTRAMLDLALAFWEGENVQADQQQAVTWMQAAHEAGDALATSLLAQWMIQGTDTLQADPPRALEMLKQAASQGEAAALLALALMHERGVGVRPDEARAAYWYERFENQSTAQSLYDLGMLFDQGRGVTQDPAFARELYDMAFALEDTQATLSFCSRLIMGLGVPADLDLASGYLRVAVESLEPSILALAGALWLQRDEQRRLAFWRDQFDAIASDRFAALNRIQGHLYASGITVEADAQKAIAFYHRAIERGDAAAATALALLILEQQPQQAMAALEMAASWGDPAAMLALADLLASQGEAHTSAFWLHEAAITGDAQAALALAVMDEALAVVDETDAE